jgi:hypothetical protein
VRALWPPRFAAPAVRECGNAHACIHACVCFVYGAATTFLLALLAKSARRRVDRVLDRSTNCCVGSIDRRIGLEVSLACRSLTPPHVYIYILYMYI